MCFKFYLFFMVLLSDEKRGRPREQFGGYLVWCQDYEGMRF